MPVGRLADALLDPAYPRGGVSVVGGEPFFHPEGLMVLLEAPRHRGCQNLLAYSGCVTRSAEITNVAY